MKVPTDAYEYQYLAGPVDTELELQFSPIQGNCRFALQLYFYRVHSLFIPKDKIYLPGGYDSLGDFIVKEDKITPGNLIPGDILYAQNSKNKDGKILNRNADQYKSLDDWRYHFHSAVYIGNLKIYHASSICDGPDVWSWEKFCEYYQPISAKRLPGLL